MAEDTTPITLLAYNDLPDIQRQGQDLFCPKHPSAGVLRRGLEIHCVTCDRLLWTVEDEPI